MPQFRGTVHGFVCGAELWSHQGVGRRAGGRNPLATFKPESSKLTSQGMEGQFLPKFISPLSLECGTFFLQGTVRPTSNRFSFQIAEEVTGMKYIRYPFYLKGQRSSGRWDQRDRAVPFFSGFNGFGDLSDFGKREKELPMSRRLVRCFGEITANISPIFLTPAVSSRFRFRLPYRLSSRRTGAQRSSRSMPESAGKNEAFEEVWWGADFLNCACRICSFTSI